MQEVTFKDIDDVLLEYFPKKFEDKRFLFELFGSIIAKPSKEKVIYGFRYFNCEPEALINYVEHHDFESIANLPYAYNEENEVGTSSVCLLMYYLASGDMVAVQVQQHINSCPTMVAEAKILFGQEAKFAVKIVKSDIDNQAK